MLDFPKTYKILHKSLFQTESHKLVPIRLEDRLKIRNWRNEQMYHLRQSDELTEKQQDTYFNTNVRALFSEDFPPQILFSLLQNEELIAYGGLVHIDWAANKAEISFIMDTRLEKNQFSNLWSTFLLLLEQVAFVELGLSKIFTYAYDLRPQLYPMLEQNGFVLEKRIKNALKTETGQRDVLIHSKTNPISIREATYEDASLLFNWSNEKEVRNQSFHSKKIDFDTHVNWMGEKIKDKNSKIYIALQEQTPIGVVRFEDSTDYTTIGTSVSKDHRGLGLGTKILKLGCSLHEQKSKKPIYAYIKNSNLASIKSFLKAHFVFKKELIIKGLSSKLYIRKK